MSSIKDLLCRPKIVLPSVYSDALSYYETVCQLAQRVEEVIQIIREYEDNSKAYTDEQIAILQASVTKQLGDTVRVLNEQYQAFETKVNANLTLFGGRLNEIDKKIDNSLIAIDERINLQIKQNNENLLDKISQGFIELKVINFFTGEAVGVQEMFNYLCTFHTDDSITYDELRDKNKTYDELIALNIDYTHLVTQGRELIV
jgi:hypothetical protein